LLIQFQGGFAGKNCTLSAKLLEGSETKVQFFPEDSNALQTFKISKITTESLKIVFEESTDFFGRIIIYKLDFFS